MMKSSVGTFAIFVFLVSRSVCSRMTTGTRLELTR